MYKSIKIDSRTRCQVSVYRTTGPLVRHPSLELWSLQSWNLVYVWTMGGCIVYTVIKLLIHTFIFLIFGFLSMPRYVCLKSSGLSTNLAKQQPSLKSLIALYLTLTILSPLVGFLCSPNRSGGTYCFWCGSHQRRHSCSFLSVLYLLNQTCTGTLLGQGEEVIRFWWPWPHFQGHTSTLKYSNFDQKKLVCTLSLNQMTDSGQTSYIVLLGRFKDLIRFWWSWPYFQGQHTIKTTNEPCLHFISWTK